MKYFDLHCDTISQCVEKKRRLAENDLQLDVKRSGFGSPYVQCFAAFIPDEQRGAAAFACFQKMAEALWTQAEENGIPVLKHPGDLEALGEASLGAVLTVENGAVLGGQLERIPRLQAMGVKMLTLTWNGENEIGRGVLAPGKTGITDFGRKALPLLEQAGIVVDVSHASPALFYDVAEIALKPLVASHSNAQRICKHPRNLTDRQFRVIRDSGGLVGLNFYKAFLNDRPSRASMEDILRHAEHFLGLGAEGVLALGSDFDGAQMPEDLPDVSGIPALYELFLRKNYKESLVEDIFFNNAAKFFGNNLLL